MPNFIEIGGVTRKPLVDLTRNDPNVSWLLIFIITCFCTFDMINNFAHMGGGWVVTLKNLINIDAEEVCNFAHIETIYNAWNSLPELVVTAPSVNTFKGHLNAHWDDLKFVVDFPAHELSK